MGAIESFTPATANEFLQERLTSPSVMVSNLHPVMQGRLVDGFLNFEKHYPKVRLRIMSGVRTKSQQAYLYNKYGSPRAADPTYSRGRDFEGIDVRGSLHQEQGRPGERKYGWAVDFELPSVGWGPVWAAFEPKGIVFVLRNLSGSANEPWHATVRGMNGWFPGPFPEVPGIWRKLVMNDIGEDVKGLQKQLGDLNVDGHFGPVTRDRVLAVQAEMGFREDGNWGAGDQRRWEAMRKPAKPARPVRVPDASPEPPRIWIPDSAAVSAIVKVAKRDLQKIKEGVDVAENARLLGMRLNQIRRVVNDGVGDD